MTPAELAAQREGDEEILRYVREMQSLAPVRMESVARYLTRIRRRRMTASQVADRLAYLVSRLFLAASDDWMPGEGDVRTYTITAAGCDVLDGTIPWGPA
jgi:hypothetical protein